MRLILTGSADYLEVQDAVNGWNNMSAATREVILTVSVLALVTLLILIWAAFVRGKGRPQHQSHSRQLESGRNPATRDSPETTLGTRTRHRRRRRKHRPLNPTLAETGGLPPVRAERPPEPAP